MKVTVAEFAAAQDVPNSVANGLVNFGVKIGQITRTEENRVRMGEDGKAMRGRPAPIYDIPETLTFDLSGTIEG